MADERISRRTFVGVAAGLAALPLTGSFGEIGRRPSAARADGARVNAWLAEFDRIGRTAGGINRVAYTDADLAGREFTLALYRAAGLTPRIDPAGNIVARLDGLDATLKPIVVGSHIDSVTDGGNFDGPLGSFAAIELARSLREQGSRLRHPLEVVVWSNEEGGLVGSKLAVGDTGAMSLDSVARSGRTLREGIGIVGGDVSRLDEAIRPRGSAACYFELHIEQGGLLEQAGIPIGIVEGIIGLRWLQVTVEGMSNHAGTTPMDQRQDAVLAAAKFTVAVNDAVRGMPGRQVATIGQVIPEPNTRNVIAGRVSLSIDLRDLDAGKLASLVATFERLGREIGAATGTRIGMALQQASAPALADSRMMGWIASSATGLGLRAQRMPSGAGHDAQAMALIAPMGMIFVPSIGGISHSPKEYTTPQDVVHGVNVLFNAVLAADGALDA